VAAAGGQPHNLGSFPVTTLQELVKEGRHMSSLQLSNSVYGRFEEQKKRDVKQAYAKMSAEEKETLKQRMAEINKGAIGDKEITTPSLTPV
jgi:hypothetical protein